MPAVMSLPARIDAVRLGVADLEAARAFYGALGWRAQGDRYPLVGAALELVDGGERVTLVAGADDAAGALAAALDAGASPDGDGFRDPSELAWRIAPPRAEGAGGWEAETADGGADADALLPRLSAITRACDDVLALRDFYEALGWHTPMERREDIAQFQTETGVFSTWIAGEAVAEVGEPLAAHGFGFTGVTLAVAAEAPEGVDTGIARAAAAGATVLVEPEDTWWGGRSGYFADPSGTPWEVVHIPSAHIDEHGLLRLGAP